MIRLIRSSIKKEENYSLFKVKDFIEIFKVSTDVYVAETGSTWFGLNQLNKYYLID